MIKCKCGSTEFNTTMVTTAAVQVTTSESGYPEHILGTEDTKNIEFSGLFECVKCKTLYSDLVDSKNEDNHITKRCSCGNTRFFAHQVCYHDIVVDSNNIFARNIGIYEAERPYGPYYCTECNAEYEELEDLEKLPNIKKRLNDNSATKGVFING